MHLVAYLAPMPLHPHLCDPAGFRRDLPRGRQLVSARWLAGLIAHGGAAAAPAAGWRLWEVACDGRAAYECGHIPGAGYLDTQQFEALPFWNLLAPPALRGLLQRLQIGPASTVILYGRNSLAAARVAHALLCLGVADVRLLDGGLAAWCAGAHALQRGAAAAPAVASVSAPMAWAGRPDYLLDLAQARAMRQQPAAALVSIRSRTEWMGETSGYSTIAQRGEIAGALWGHAGDDGDVNSMSSFQDAAGCMLPAAQIEQLWARAGIHRELRVGFYCGTGWRASLAFFYAWLMGWERISVFDGGWMQWSADAANPVVCRSPALAESAP